MAFPICSAASEVSTTKVKASLLSEYSEIVAGQSFSVLLKLDIPKGWHTYWKNPGESGLPTRLDWNLPESTVVSEINWPFPHRIPFFELVNYGYSDTAYHIVDITFPLDVGKNGETITLSADASWLVCKNICIPEQARVQTSVVIAQNELLDHSKVATFNTARSLLPIKNSEIILEQPQLFEDGANVILRLPIELSDKLLDGEIRSVYFFSASKEVIHPSLYQRTQLVKGQGSANASRLYLHMKKHEFSEFDQHQLPGVVVIDFSNAQNHLDMEQSVLALEIDAVLNPDMVDLPSDAINLSQALGSDTLSDASDKIMGNDLGFGLAVIFAFLGGIILNLMPCVLPIIMMKLINMAQSSTTRQARIESLIYSLGVFATFFVISSLLFVVKSLGEEIGWGFQLQSPLFVASMVVLFFLIGLNLLGFMDIQLTFPSRFSKNSLVGRQFNYQQSFITGVLAVTVATPCTAPFMASAIGFALTQSTLIGYFVLMSLAAGFVFPYVFASWIPATKRLFPKPGEWMLTLKQFLAFPMFASAIWLAWVLTKQTDADGIALVLLALLLISIAIWFSRQRREQVGQKARAILFILATTLVLTSVTLLTFISNTEPERKVSYSQGATIPFSKQELQQNIQDERIVFVNFTADWCITCKFNERLILNSPEIKAIMEENDVAYMIADWTLADDSITKFLNKIGRSGIPLYLVYHPRRGNQPIILPQILTKSIVVDALS